MPVEHLYQFVIPARFMNFSMGWSERPGDVETKRRRDGKRRKEKD